MERYNFKTIEAKWQKFWDYNKTFQTKTDKSKKKIFLLRNVSISVRQNSHGTC